MDKKNKSWLFTLNNYTEEDIQAIKAWSTEVSRIRVAKEVGERGTPHLQGKVVFKHAKRLSALKKLHNKISWHAKQSAGEDDFLYVMKADSECIIDVNNAKQGERNDLKAAYARIAAGESAFEVALDTGKPLRMLQDMEIEVKRRKVVPSKIVELRPWQQVIWDKLQQEPHDREIIWVVDEQGGQGKTAFAQYIHAHLKAFYTNGGKHADIAHAYDYEPVVIFDFARSAEEYVSYALIEQMKNGLLFSPKYNSTMKRFPRPHVVVFSNFQPDRSKLSEDRWDVHQLRSLGQGPKLP